MIYTTSLSATPFGIRFKTLEDYNKVRVEYNKSNDKQAVINKYLTIR